MFVDKGNIPLIHGKDYDIYCTPNTNRVDETSFTEPDTTEATATLQLRQKVKRDKITAMYRHLNMTCDPGNTDLLFLDGNNHWQSLTNKHTGEFLAAKTLKEKFGG